MRRTPTRLPFRYLEPAFFAGLLDDPVLFLRIRPLRRALLFDCGQIAHLAKRVVKPIETVFVTHAHMDHLMGLPTLVRHHHASPRPVDLFGPAGIAARVEHLLRGFDWNLCEPTWFTLRVHEIDTEEIRHVSFSGPDGFERREEGTAPRLDRVIWSCRYLTVAAELLDHKLPVLAYRIDERSPFAVDPERLKEHNLRAGPWIRELKHRLWHGQADTPSIQLPGAADGLNEQPGPDAQNLYASIRQGHSAAAIGYLTDIGWTVENQARIENFLGGLTLLCSECSFLAADQEKARVSYHLCTSDLNLLTRQLHPRYLLPMHLSKSYLRRCAELYRELQPPPGTSILPLPPHLVPAPLQVDDISQWLRPGRA